MGAEEYYLAAHLGNKELYSILTRTTSLVKTATINAALSNYSAGEVKVTLISFIRDNPFLVIATIVVIIAMMLVILAQSRLLRAERKAEERKKQMDVLNERVFVDALTSVRNKGAYVDHIQKLQARGRRGAGRVRHRRVRL